MEIRPASDLDGDGDETGGIPRVDPSEISAARAAEFGNDSGNSSRGPGESRSERAKRAWETRRANGNAPAVKTDAKSGGSTGKKTHAPLSANSIEFALTGIHALLAAGLSAPELVLQEAEAKVIAENVVAVARHYDLQASAKATDWGNLVVSLGVVYGGRVVAITVRKTAEIKSKRNSPEPILSPKAPIQSPMNAVTKPPENVTIHHPNAAGQPNGANPPTRPKTREDDKFLNEIEPAMF